MSDEVMQLNSRGTVLAQKSCKLGKTLIRPES
jgi:hypothetical protein